MKVSIPATRSRVSTRPAAAALLLAGLAFGCAGTPLPVPGPHHFTINFKPDDALHRPCPYEVVVDNEGSQCVEGFLLGSKKPDCLNASKGDEVTFKAKLVGPGRGDLEFALDFDPFRKGSIHSKDGALSLRIDPKAPKKTYTFNVYSGECPVVDPRIIITR